MPRNAHRTRSSVVRGPIILAAGAVLIGWYPAYGQNGALGIAYPVEGIVVDGDLGDWPEEARTYPIARVEYGELPEGDEDLKAHFRIGYEAAGHTLYVAVEVADEAVIIDESADESWDSQDGCELYYVDAGHVGGGSSAIQYTRYGDRDQVRPPGVSEDARTVAVTRTDATIVYEWRIDVGAEIESQRVIGFDVSVADRDEDGSFSWVAWGSGTQKYGRPDRCGEVLLARPDETRFGDIAGNIAWEDSSSVSLPARVRIQSLRSTPLWRMAIVDPTGAYEATDLPEGPYSVHPVDSADLRVDATAHVAVRVEADRLATADLLRVRRLPWPGLIGDEGVLHGPEPVNTDELDRFIRTYLDYFMIPGISVAVIKDSEVVYRRGFGVKDAATREPVAADTMFEAASMTKPVFAYLVLRLVDRGVLELDTPLYTYLPYEDIAHDDRYKLITARMVLTHRTGFPNWRTGQLDIKFTPGTEVLYSGEAFFYLGKVVEHLTGTDLVDLFHDEVFVPLGIENASLVWDEDVTRSTARGHDGNAPLAKAKPDEPNVAASLHIDAGNYAKFLIAALRGEGLSESATGEMLCPQAKRPDDEGRRTWGLGIDIEDTPRGPFFGHGGRNTGFTSRSRMSKELGIGYVVLVNNDDILKVNNVLNAYLIAGKSGLVYHTAADVDPGVYDAYVGRYEDQHEAVAVTISREGDRLMAQFVGVGTFEVFPESETVFFLDPATDATFTFVKDEEGHVTRVELLRDGRKTTAERLGPGPDLETIK